MSISKNIAGLEGRWNGINEFYTPGNGELPSESPSEATVRTVVAGKFIEIAYTWIFEGQPQEGSIILGCDPASTAVQAVWTDSWHMSDRLMLCDGTIAHDGTISVVGSHGGGSGREAKFGIEITAVGETFTIRMFDISPTGVKQMAVETVYSRV